MANELNLYKLLKHTLPQRTNKRFVKRRYERKKNKSYELHHLTKSFMGGGKHNDYLLAEISPELHKKIHYGDGISNEEFTRLFVNCLDEIFIYIEELEKEIYDLHNA